MKINLITQEKYNQLLEIFNNYENLTLQNKGYETIDKSKLTEVDIERIKEVTEILKKAIVGFESFTNFRLRDNQVEIRFQYNYGWDEKGVQFIGVGYILLEELLNGFIN